MRAVILAALAALVAGPALADQQHDVAWYRAHPGRRAATARVCQNDARFRHDSDCINADTAGTLNYADSRAKEARRLLDATSTTYRTPLWVMTR